VQSRVCWQRRRQDRFEARLSRTPAAACVVRKHTRLRGGGSGWVQ
jgi:hypothetical protein